MSAAVAVRAWMTPGFLCGLAARAAGPSFSTVCRTTTGRSTAGRAARETQFVECPWLMVRWSSALCRASGKPRHHSITPSAS